MGPLREQGELREGLSQDPVGGESSREQGPTVGVSLVCGLGRQGRGAARRPVWLKCSEIGHSGGEMVEAGMTILAISW